MPRVCVHPALGSGELVPAPSPPQDWNAESWLLGYPFGVFSRGEAQEGEVLFLQWVVLAPESNCRARDWTLCGLSVPNYRQRRLRHATVRLLNFPFLQQTWRLVAVGWTKEGKEKMHNQVGTASAKHVASISLLRSVGETRLQGEVLVT